jgi:hypothetical protein
MAEAIEFRSGAGLAEGNWVAKTSVANAVEKVWVIAKVAHRLINVSAVMKGLKRP